LEEEGAAVSPRAVEGGKEGERERGKRKVSTKVVAWPLLRCRRRREPLEEGGGAVSPQAVEGGKEE